MAIRFESLELGDPGALGIRLRGAYGRGDGHRLRNLADRCIQSQKSRLVLDCRDLDSLGGRGAAVLADLQRRLRDRSCELVFVAVGEVIGRFLEQNFVDLPLRCFDSIETAVAAAAVIPAESRDAAGSGQKARARSVLQPKMVDLDQLLEAVESGDERPAEQARRTADLVTASYVTVFDVLLAAEGHSNPAVMGEALGVLLAGQDLAAEVVYFYAQDDRYTATSGRLHVPAAGGIVAGLSRSRRPLTLLDLEDSDLLDEESRILEELQPDLILPLVRRDELMGIAFLKRSGAEHEYGISEIFALELLLLLISQDRAAVVSEEIAEPDPDLEPDPAPVPEPAPATVVGPESLLGIKLELMRDLREAQDSAHFWQVFISRMRDAAEITGLVCFNTAESPTAVCLAGNAPSGLRQELLEGERIQAFFRTLQCPVEIVNMPSSLELVRNMLLGCGLHWLAPMRTDAGQGFGVLALGLHWHCRLADPGAELQEIMEITAGAMLRLREGQDRADMNLGLLEELLVGGRPASGPDLATRETVKALRLLAREMGLTCDQERDLVLGALLRNHGQERLDFDDLTADRLTGQEWELYRSHPDDGDRLLAALKAPVAVRDAVRHHHERFDGRGFPQGLKGRDIPLSARMVAVAQCHALHLINDATAEAALGSIRHEAGSSLDPDLVEIFLKAARRAETDPVHA